MARPSGQNTMKPITISAMVAGVQAELINADVFMFVRSFHVEAADRLLEFRHGKAKTAIQDRFRSNLAAVWFCGAFLSRSRPMTISPATSPQKAEPILKIARPEAVTAKVTVAAIRPASSFSAMVSALASEPVSASP